MSRSSADRVAEDAGALGPRRSYPGIFAAPSASRVASVAGAVGELAEPVGEPVARRR